MVGRRDINRRLWLNLLEDMPKNLRSVLLGAIVAQPELFCSFRTLELAKAVSSLFDFQLWWIDYGKEVFGIFLRVFIFKHRLTVGDRAVPRTHESAGKWKTVPFNYLLQFLPGRPISQVFPKKRKIVCDEPTEISGERFEEFSPVEMPSDDEVFVPAAPPSSLFLPSPKRPKLLEPIEEVHQELQSISAKARLEDLTLLLEKTTTNKKSLTYLQAQVQKVTQLCMTDHAKIWQTMRQSLE